MSENQIVVIKYGGSAMGQGFEEVIEDVAALWKQGVKIVLVHGGGKEISTLITRLGIETRFIDGIRVTDAETLEIVQMVLGGSVNKRIVSHLLEKGVPAFGLSGVDAGMIQVVPKSDLDSLGPLGYVGEVKQIDARPILELLKAGYLPVMAPLGTDGEGQNYNLNGDTAAGAIAGALDAEKLILLTDVPGILRETSSGKELISKVTPSEIQQLIEEGTIYGGMIPKVGACLSALEAGAKQVQILNGAEAHILLESNGKGTTVVEALS